MKIVTYIYIGISVVLATVTALLTGPNAALAWKIPLFAVGFFVAIVLIHAIILGVSILAVDLKKDNKKISRYYRVLTLVSLDFQVLRRSGSGIAGNLSGLKATASPADRQA